MPKSRVKAHYRKVKGRKTKVRIRGHIRKRKYSTRKGQVRKTARRAYTYR